MVGNPPSPAAGMPDSGATIFCSGQTSPLECRLPIGPVVPPPPNPPDDPPRPAA